MPLGQDASCSQRALGKTAPQKAIIDYHVCYHFIAYFALQGFKIIFEFSDNSFFSNRELVKTYYMVSDDAADPVLQKATGTTIQWASGKNPGVKVIHPGFSEMPFTFILEATIAPCPGS